MTEQWRELKETITEMRDNGGTGTQQDVCKFLANYMETLEKQMQQPCEDCISREAVIDAINARVTGSQDKEFIVNEILSKTGMYSLPPVTPERPKGKWIEDTQTGFKIRCSDCGARNFGADRAYCPRCGRQMKEDNDD